MRDENKLEQLLGNKVAVTTLLSSTNNDIVKLGKIVNVEPKLWMFILVSSNQSSDIYIYMSKVNKRWNASIP